MLTMQIKLIERLLSSFKENEEFEALDNKKYKLKKGMCVITDKSSVWALVELLGGQKLRQI